MKKLFLPLLAGLFVSNIYAQSKTVTMMQLLPPVIIELPNSVVMKTDPATGNYRFETVTRNLDLETTRLRGNGVTAPNNRRIREPVQTSLVLKHLGDKVGTIQTVEIAIYNKAGELMGSHIIE